MRSDDCSKKGLNLSGCNMTFKAKQETMLLVVGHGEIWDIHKGQRGRRGDTDTCKRVYVRVGREHRR